MHCITFVLEKWTTVVVSMHNVRRSCFTLSRTYESCLACQHFISNLIYFVNLLTIFCFSIRMPIDTCSNIPGFLKTGLAKISTHSTTWQFKTTKLIQRPIKSLYLTPGSKLVVPRSIRTSPHLT